MKIYIAASWKHQHAVEMLTFFLREAGHEATERVHFHAVAKQLTRPAEAREENQDERCGDEDQHNEA